MSFVWLSGYWGKAGRDVFKEKHKTTQQQTEDTDNNKTEDTGPIGKARSPAK